MTRIGLLSDTHGYIDKRMLDILADCDEIWHAGDIGATEVALQLEAIKPVRAVWGNIDGADIRRMYKQHNRFEIEGLTVFMTHIGGYPGKYDTHIVGELQKKPLDIFVCGHSHILKVMNDTKNSFLCLNPGAAGIYGFHIKRTMLLFTIDNGLCKDMSVVEWDK